VHDAAAIRRAARRRRARLDLDLHVPGEEAVRQAVADEAADARRGRLLADGFAPNCVTSSVRAPSPSEAAAQKRTSEDLRFMMRYLVR
jgi:hypothetical protein